MTLELFVWVVVVCVIVVFATEYIGDNFDVD